jgi:hypothetical protein
MVAFVTFLSRPSMAASAAEVDAQNNVLLAIMSECDGIHRALQNAKSQPEKDSLSIKLGQCVARMQKQREIVVKSARDAGMTVNTN